MGCDIHSYTEGLIKGEWVYLGSVVIYRNYALFGVMAGVRDEEISCVSGEWKELPDDATKQVNTMSDNYGHGHSHSYLNYEELLEAKKIYDEYMKKQDWNSSFPKAIIALKKVLKLPFIDDVRIVFWFDN